MSQRSRGIWSRAQDPWWDAIGVGGAIILGLILLFFPEPATSVLGVIIIVAAVLVWLGVDIRQEMVHGARGGRERGGSEERAEAMGEDD